MIARTSAGDTPYIRVRPPQSSLPLRRGQGSGSSPGRREASNDTGCEPGIRFQGRAGSERGRSPRSRDRRGRGKDPAAAVPAGPLTAQSTGGQSRQTGAADARNRQEIGKVGKRLRGDGAKLLKNGLAPQVGFEPTTLRLTAECSTVELLRSKDVSCH